MLDGFGADPNLFAISSFFFCTLSSLNLGRGFLVVGGDAAVTAYSFLCVETLELWIFSGETAASVFSQFSEPAAIGSGLVFSEPDGVGSSDSPLEPDPGSSAA